MNKGGTIKNGKEKTGDPSEVKMDFDDPANPFPVGHHVCPKCGYDLELYVADGDDKENWKRDCNYCPHCGKHIVWPKKKE
jgi:hypothetical protein